MVRVSGDWNDSTDSLFIKNFGSVWATRTVVQEPGEERGSTLSAIPLARSDAILLWQVARWWAPVLTSGGLPCPHSLSSAALFAFSSFAFKTLQSRPVPTWESRPDGEADHLPPPTLFSPLLSCGHRHFAPNYILRIFFINAELCAKEGRP